MYVVYVEFANIYIKIIFFIKINKNKKILDIGKKCIHCIH